MAFLLKMMMKKKMKEKKEINIEANIPAETEREPVKIVKETTKEQEPTVADYLPTPWVDKRMNKKF